MIEVLELERQLKIDKSDWTLMKLGDLAEDISTRVDNPAQSGYDRFVGLEHFVSGELKIKSWGTTKNLTSSVKAFQKGDILFARRNAYLRRASLVDFNGICSGDAFVIRENHNKVVPGFLAFVMNSTALWDYANSNAAGTMSKRVKWRDLAEYEFLLPPKDQQEQIAELLWAGEDLSLNETEVYQSILLQLTAFTNSKINRGYESSIQPLPVNWKLAKLGSVSKVQAGSTPLRAEKTYYENGSIPWVKTLDLNNGEISQTEEKITEVALAKTSCKVRPIDTVLVAMYGGFNQIGRTGILKLPAATNQAVSAVMVDRDILQPEYLLHLLNSRVEYWKKVAISSRKDPNITKVDIENFPVAIPPLEEQKEIIETINSLLHTKKQIENRIENTKQLQKTIINQIF